jgi:hypothetical protein
MSAEIEFTVRVYPERRHVTFGRKWVWSAEATEIKPAVDDEGRRVRRARFPRSYAVRGHKTEERAIEALRLKIESAQDEHDYIEANTSTARFTVVRD